MLPLCASPEELRVPAYTAYASPEADAARISVRRGITDWKSADSAILWFGEFKMAGEVECSVALRLPAGMETELQLTVAGISRAAKVRGNGTNLVTAAFGKFVIAKPGYQSFTLASLNEKGNPAGDLDVLILDGPAAQNARFNLKERRNAASVHLNYSPPSSANVAAFYCEVMAVEDPVWTFYMACGFHRGYFGMQINSPTERRIIFSVWDKGGEKLDRHKVAEADRVKLAAKGEGVVAEDFGNEGTGGHSHLVYSWKTREKQRFLVTAKPGEGAHTIYSGFYFHPDKKQWVLISSWDAPKDGHYLRGLHSFSENFGGANGQLRRKALFGNQWIKTAEGQWQEITTASFSHDPTGTTDRLDRFMGVENGQFFLSHGGFVDGFTRFGESFTRPSIGLAPQIKLPEMPANALPLIQ